ncbi:MAG: hypothetical protein AMXMBFR7_19120 [Planctomycetota bacterium]
MVTAALIGGLVCVSLAAGGMVYLTRLGVQFSLSDLMLAVLAVGLTPALGGMAAGEADPELATRAWIGALALTVLAILYQLVGFCWAALRPAAQPSRRLWQRFGPVLALTICTAIAMACFV